MNEVKSRSTRQHKAIYPFGLVAVALFFTAITLYAQGSMGSGMGNMQHMQNMNNMQNMASMSDMMQHMHVMTGELSGMIKEMNSMKGMDGMKGMGSQMSMMQQMKNLGMSMESLLGQMDETMNDKAMMEDPQMKDHMMQMQIHMGSLVNDYHEMMQNLKKEQNGGGK